MDRTRPVSPRPQTRLPSSDASPADYAKALVYDWDDPFGRLFLQTLAMVAEFEANLIRLRTREGMAVAKRKGKLRGKQPKLSESAQRSIRARYAEGGLSLADLAEEYRVGRSTIHRVIHGDPAAAS
jgi:DNA invertase Pin-like site-specific DNA recombinase